MHCQLLFNAQLGLLTFFSLLQATLSYENADNSIINSVPPEITTVVGIFRRETCSPAVATALAVSQHNQNMNVTSFTYRFILDVSLSSLSDIELSSTLNNSILVTGYPFTTEWLASSSVSSSDFNSYLVYYGPLHPSTLQTVEEMEPQNFYLSSPNPQAFVPCLVRLLKFKLRRFENIDSKQTDIDKVYVSDTQDSSSFLSVVIVADPNHSFSMMKRSLANNLSRLNLKVDTISVNDNLPSFIHELNETLRHSESPIIIASVYDFTARNLLCSLYKMRCYRKIKGFTLILIDEAVGLRNKMWLQDEEEMEYYKDEAESESCTKEELLAAAEGHFLLEFPAWEVRNELKTRLFKKELDETLRVNRENVRYDYDEGPLAYDSTVSMLKAISRASELITSSGENFPDILEKELSQLFYGVSGEFSFNEQKMRSGRKAVISLNWFEKGSYLKIGNYFNGNSSLSLDKSWIGRKDIWNVDLEWKKNETCFKRETPSNCVFKTDCASANGSGSRNGPPPTTIIMTVVLLLLVLIVLVSSLFLISRMKKQRTRILMK